MTAHVVRRRIVDFGPFDAVVSTSLEKFTVSNANRFHQDVGQSTAACAQMRMQRCSTSSFIVIRFGSKKHFQTIIIIMYFVRSSASSFDSDMTSAVCLPLAANTILYLDQLERHRTSLAAVFDAHCLVFTALVC